MFECIFSLCINHCSVRKILRFDDQPLSPSLQMCKYVWHSFPSWQCIFLNSTLSFKSLLFVHVAVTVMMPTLLLFRKQAMKEFADYCNQRRHAQSPKTRSCSMARDERTRDVFLNAGSFQGSVKNRALMSTLLSFQVKSF